MGTITDEINNRLQVAVSNCQTQDPIALKANLVELKAALDAMSALLGTQIATL